MFNKTWSFSIKMEQEEPYICRRVREFAQILEDALNIMALPLYEKTNAMGSTFVGKDKDRL